MRQLLIILSLRDYLMLPVSIKDKKWIRKSKLLLSKGDILPDTSYEGSKIMSYIIKPIEMGDQYEADYIYAYEINKKTYFLHWITYIIINHLK